MFPWFYMHMDACDKYLHGGDISNERNLISTTFILSQKSELTYFYRYRFAIKKVLTNK